ncbi:hypothetical protein E4U42_007907, partial [Claviceps africana]
VVHGLTIPLGQLGYLAPRLHRVLSESLTDTLSNEGGWRTPVIGRCFSAARDEDAEANLAARVRGGTASITRTGQGEMPTKIREQGGLKAAVVAATPSGPDGNSAESSKRTNPVSARAAAEDVVPSRADAAGEVGTAAAGTMTPTRGARREIVFFDEVGRRNPDVKATSNGNA